MIKERQNDLSWMLSDTAHLLRDNRPYGALLLLLCAVDALASQSFPTLGVRERFEEYLKTKMRRTGRPQVHNIFVPPRNELLTFEYILYKYLRNPVVHEGARLELDHPCGYAVQIDWDKLSCGLKVDSEHNRVIIGGELIIDILIDAVTDGLKEGTTIA